MMISSTSTSAALAVLRMPRRKLYLPLLVLWLLYTTAFVSSFLILVGPSFSSTTRSTHHSNRDPSSFSNTPRTNGLDYTYKNSDAPLSTAAIPTKTTFHRLSMNANGQEDSNLMSTNSENEHEIENETKNDNNGDDDSVMNNVTTSSKVTIEGQKQQQSTPSINKPTPSKKFVVVGAGWGGWGAAQTLIECQNNNNHHQVILLDALPDPTGHTPYLSRTGKPVEAGTRGFWKDYPNINRLVRDELALHEVDIFTDFTNSSFYSPDGLEATAPVFSNAVVPSNSLPFLSQWSGQKLPPLPSPLGQVLATFPLFERLPLSDRASMVGLLLATVDVWAGDEACKTAYDRMTAHELFIQFGLSERLVRDFITPTLLVGLFMPPHELSALVVMELLYYYALAHTDSFDVRWIRNGTVADSLLAPLADRLMHGESQAQSQPSQSTTDNTSEPSSATASDPKNRLQVMGGCRVTRIGTTFTAKDNGLEVHEIEYLDSATGETRVITNVDGVILAVTAKGMQSIVQGSPALAQNVPSLAQAATCRGIDVLSVRLWLDRIVPTRTPANVWARFDELRGAGGTFFMLDQLQSSPWEQQALWGGAAPQGSVVACDFYNAGALLALSDEDMVHTILRDLLPAAVPAFADAQLVDQWVGRYPGAVSWFAPGSYTKRPPLEPPGIANLKCAGDWVRLPASVEAESAKGLCQERAYASGMHAANALLQQAYGAATMTKKVLPVRPDEPQFRAAMEINRQVMKVLPRFWVR